MKLIIQRLWILIVALSASVAASAYDFEVDGIYYNVVSLSDLTCEVAKGGSKYTGDIEIPSVVKYNSCDLKVVAVSENAFSGCDGMTSIVIPNSVTTIGDWAFNTCEGLTSVVIGNSVTSIGDYAFYYCRGLTSVVIPDSVTTIGNNAFYACRGLTSVVIGNSVTTIGDQAFKGCYGLTSVVIPNSVTAIGKGAFESCSSLTSVVLGNSITTIGDDAFFTCHRLASVDIPNSVTTIGDWAFCACDGLTSVVIPNSVTTLGYGAFCSCDSLTNIELGSGLSKLELETFHECSSLESITIPGNIEKIESRRYDGYTFDRMALTDIRFEYGDKPLDFDMHYFNLKTVYVDRELSSLQTLTSLIEYSIGDNVVKNQIDLAKSDDLESINCYAITPPELNCKPTKTQYMDVVVRVTNESLEAYRNAEGWKNFRNIQGFEASGIDEVGASAEEPIEAGRFDIHGRRVSEGHKGFTIIRYSDGGVRKTVL